MQDWRRLVGTAWIVVGLLAAPAVATAGGQLYDWNSEKAPILVTNDRGVFFVRDNGKVERAYSWERAGGEHKKPLYVVDIDADGSFEILGAGTPTFVLDSKGDPVWTIDEGCGEVIVGDFHQSDGLEFMCNQGSAVRIMTHDRQTLWSLDPGIEIDHCRAGDVNGDLKLDLECAFSGRDDWIRISSEGKILASSTTKQKIEEKPVDLDEASPVPSSVWKGEKEYDLNGDGTAEESITADGTAIVIESRSKKSAVARTNLAGEIRAATVKNVDGEGKPEIVALTDSQIVILNHEGEIQHEFPADPDEYDRQPVAEFQSIYARKFSDNKKAKKAIEDKKSEFAKCYEDQVRGKFPPGSGQMILKAYLDPDGELDRIELMHSAIADTELQECAKDVLRSVEFPKPASADEEDDDTQATANVVIKYTYADRP